MPLITTSDRRYDLDTDRMTISPHDEIPAAIAQCMPTITPIASFDDDAEIELEIRLAPYFPGIDREIAVYECEYAENLRDEITEIFSRRPPLDDRTSPLFDTLGPDEY